MRHLSRRHTLHLLGLAGAAGLVRPVAKRAASIHGAYAPGSDAGRTAADPDVEIALDAAIAQVSLKPGPKSEVWRFEAKVTKGDPAAVQVLDAELGLPVIRIATGQRLRVNFTNRLNESTTVHWHGLNIPADMDGHPHDLIAPGGTFTYEFPILNPAGTYWFHPHPHLRTGLQVSKGLVGFLFVTDAEQEAGLPTRDAELPILLQDRTLDSDNTNVYSPNQMGFLGDEIAVNGRAGATIAVEPKPFRLRLLNGSTNRVYKLGWSDKRQVTVIGTEAGLLAEPITRPYVMLAPGERLDLQVDFAVGSTGEALKLQNFPYDNGLTRMMDSMRPTKLPEGSAYDVIKFEVATVLTATPAVGPTATATPAVTPTDGATATIVPTPWTTAVAITPTHTPARPAATATATPKPSLLRRLFVPRADRRGPPLRRVDVNALRHNSDQPSPIDTTPTRRIVLGLGAGIWNLNGRKFEMHEVADDEIVTLGSEAIWEWDNTAAGMLMAHSMHVHLVRFQVVERTIDARHTSNYNTVNEGFVDEGWKDTVFVSPGERVKVKMKFVDYTGLYLYHCHMLDHEDLGMMRNFRVDPPK